MGKNIDLTGATIGDITVVAQVGVSPRGRKRWLCRCKCGAEVIRETHAASKAKSCGCAVAKRLRESVVTHGQSRSRTYRIWCGIKTRTKNRNATGYDHYGGRGVRLDPRWDTYEQFVADMGECPGPEWSLDRYPDRDGDYSPDNCRWATRRQQAMNTRRTVFVTIDGVERPAQDVAAEHGVNYGAFKMRYYILGWSLLDACTKPVRRKSK